MIPRSLHIKDYFWSYDQKYQKFSYYFLYIFSSFNRKYLNFTKMDLSVFANKLFILLACVWTHQESILREARLYSIRGVGVNASRAGDLSFSITSVLYLTDPPLFGVRAKHSTLINIIIRSEEQRCFLQGTLNDFFLFCPFFLFLKKKKGLKYNFAADLGNELTRKNGGEIKQRGRCPQ